MPLFTRNTDMCLQRHSYQLQVPFCSVVTFQLTIGELLSLFSLNMQFGVYNHHVLFSKSMHTVRLIVKKKHGLHMAFYMHVIVIELCE